MGLNKKGVFFTITALVLISILFTSFVFYDQVNERKSAQARVVTMKNFLFSTERDLSRSLYIAGFRWLFTVEKDISTSGEYNPNPESYLNEMFFNGTFNGAHETLMEEATFDDIVTEISARADKINAQIALNSPQIYVAQEDPWRVKITLNVTLNFSDKTNAASWNKQSLITVYVPIDSFDDPFYLISTGGKINRKIVRSSLSFKEGDKENISMSMQNKYYIADSLAPSFMDRLKGQNSASEYGISSLVNVEQLYLESLPTPQKSIVDYVYFSAMNPESRHVLGLPAWFKIDDAHALAYNVSTILE